MQIRLTFEYSFSKFSIYVFLGSMNTAIENICKTCSNSDDRLKVAAIDMLTCLFDHSSVSIYYLIF